MSANRESRIAIRTSIDQPARKITKIVGLNGDGFSVIAPYHKARSGVLFKLPVDPKKALAPGEWQSSWAESVAFTVEDRAKLSYHTDGFIQFSSESPGRIISGREPSTGEPKGLGLMTHPLTSPIWTGASASVTAWGLEEFDVAEESKDLMVFEPNEVYFRGCTPDEATAWRVEIYPFPIDVVPPVRFDKGNAYFDMTVQPMNGALAAVVQMKVIHLSQEKVFLGIYINAFIGHFPSSSGWVLGGAGSWGKDRVGHVLKGVYPRELIPVDGRACLDRG